ncbi:hypothetical protein HK096_009636 [Nowakowskiella sp. JEL0078]|nr:hypothetical protein HK096_009636 [Nowakowskiella sp. JEL0078]
MLCALRAADYKDVYRIFNAIESSQNLIPNKRSLLLYLSALLSDNKSDQVISFFNNLVSHSPVLEKDLSILCLVLEAHASNGDYDRARAIFSKIEATALRNLAFARSKWSDNLVIQNSCKVLAASVDESDNEKSGNTVLDSVAKLVQMFGTSHKVSKLFDRFIQPFEAWIKALVSLGRLQEALQAAVAFTEAGWMLSENVYDSLIAGCVNEGNYELAEIWWSQLLAKANLTEFPLPSIDLLFSNEVDSTTQASVEERNVRESKYYDNLIKKSQIIQQASIRLSTQTFNISEMMPTKPPVQRSRSSRKSTNKIFQRVSLDLPSSLSRFTFLDQSLQANLNASFIPLPSIHSDHTSANVRGRLDTHLVQKHLKNITLDSRRLLRPHRNTFNIMMHINLSNPDRVVALFRLLERLYYPDQDAYGHLCCSLLGAGNVISVKAVLVEMVRRNVKPNGELELLLTQLKI